MNRKMGTGPIFLAALVSASALGGKEAPVQVHKGPGCVLPQWAEQLWPSPEAVVFKPTTLEEREVFSRVFPQLLSAAREAGPAPVSAVESLARVGFLLETWRTPQDTFWVLRERPEQRRGAGAYLLRTGPASHDFIQAPHAYFDQGTGPLAAALFVCPPPGTRPRLFATNTAHRFKGTPGGTREEPDHPADVAHNPYHLFQRVTDLSAQNLANLRVFQLHGFADSSENRRELVAVISDGSRRPAPTVRRLSGRLATLLGTGVRLFPEETELLGATQNAQARLLQSYPGTTFIHLELSAGARRLLASSTELGRLGAALLAPFEVQ